MYKRPSHQPKQKTQGGAAKSRRHISTAALIEMMLTQHEPFVAHIYIEGACLQVNFGRGVGAAYLESTNRVVDEISSVALAEACKGVQSIDVEKRGRVLLNNPDDWYPTFSRPIKRIVVEVDL